MIKTFIYSFLFCDIYFGKVFPTLFLPTCISMLDQLQFYLLWNKLDICPATAEVSPRERFYWLFEDISPLIHNSILYISLSFSLFSFWHCGMACEISVPQSGTEPRPGQWKCQVLTTRPPGNSLYTFLSCFMTLIFFSVSVLSSPDPQPSFHVGLSRNLLPLEYFASSLLPCGSCCLAKLSSLYT